MPRFTQAEATAMLSGGGEGFRTEFRVTAPTAANGICWHTRNWYDASTGLIDSEFHTITVGSDDTTIPYTLPALPDTVKITVVGVGDGGADEDYEVRSIKQLGNGFRQIMLSTPYVSPINFPAITISNQTAGTESSGIALSATGGDNIMFSIVDTTNTRGRIANNSLFL